MKRSNKSSKFNFGPEQQPPRPRNRARIPGGNITDQLPALNYAAVGAAINTNSVDSFLITSRLYVPGYNSGFSGAPAGVTVAGLYNEGVFLPGSTATWMPTVSATTNGRLWVAWLENPEQIANFLVATSTGQFNILRSIANVKSSQVWQPMTYQIPSQTRKKSFDVNQAVLLSDANVLDRCCQGLLIVAVEGVPKDTWLGQMQYYDRLKLRGLSNVAT